MKHTRKRRAFAQRPFPIGLTPFRGVANRLLCNSAPSRFREGFYFTIWRCGLSICVELSRSEWCWLVAGDLPPACGHAHQSGAPKTSLIVPLHPLESGGLSGGGAGRPGHGHGAQLRHGRLRFLRHSHKHLRLQCGGGALLDGGLVSAGRVKFEVLDGSKVILVRLTAREIGPISM